MGNKVQGGGSGTTVLELIEKGGADLLADDKLAPECASNFSPCSASCNA